jgi:hypothetical protein
MNLNLRIGLEGRDTESAFQPLEMVNVNRVMHRIIPIDRNLAMATGCIRTYTMSGPSGSTRLPKATATTPDATHLKGDCACIERLCSLGNFLSLVFACSKFRKHAAALQFPAQGACTLCSCLCNHEHSVP